MAHLGAFKNMFEEIQDPAAKGGKLAQVNTLRWGVSVLGREECGIHWLTASVQAFFAAD